MKQEETVIGNEFKQPIEVTHWKIKMFININEHELTYSEAWQPCGDGTWIYCKERNSLERVSIGSHGDIPYSFGSFHSRSTKNHYYKVTASSYPLWVWWGEGCMELNWDDKIGIALPKLEI